MGKVTELKKSVEEQSMASNGANPLAIVKGKCEGMYKDKKMSEEEKEKIYAMMKEMDMDEEMDMEEFKKAVDECGSFSEMKSVIEKYMK